MVLVAVRLRTGILITLMATKITRLYTKIMILLMGSLMVRNSESFDGSGVARLRTGIMISFMTPIKLGILILMSSFSV